MSIDQPLHVLYSVRVRIRLIAAAAAAILVALTAGCSGTDTSAFPAVTVSDYVAGYHIGGPPPGPDQKILSTSEKFCTALRQGHPVATAVRELQTAWDDPDLGVAMAATAVGPGPHALCPDQLKTFTPWFLSYGQGLPAPGASGS